MTPRSTCMAIAIAAAAALATGCTQEKQNEIRRSIQNWTGTNGVLEVYASDKLVRRFIGIDKLSTASGTDDNQPITLDVTRLAVHRGALSWADELTGRKLALAELNRHEPIGPLGVRLVYPDGKLQHTARRFRSIRNELLDLARPLLKLLPYEKRSDLMLNQYFRGDRNTLCDWVSGAFFMFHRQMLDKMPDHKLDERYFMYGEDQLWCLQAQQLGYPSYYYAGTTVTHIHAASTAPAKQLKLLKKFLALELDIMAIRKGKTLYYYLFSAILTFKEMMRYYIKVFALKVLGKNIR